MNVFEYMRWWQGGRRLQIGLQSDWQEVRRFEDSEDRAAVHFNGKFLTQLASRCAWPAICSVPQSRKSQQENLGQCPTRSVSALFVGSGCQTPEGAAICGRVFRRWPGTRRSRSLLHAFVSWELFRLYCISYKPILNPKQPPTFVNHIFAISSSIGIFEKKTLLFVHRVPSSACSSPA